MLQGMAMRWAGSQADPRQEAGATGPLEDQGVRLWAWWPEGRVAHAQTGRQDPLPE